MQSSSPAAVRLGIFVMGGLAILFGISIFAQGFTMGRGSYKLYAYFRDTSGLEIGSRVTIRGVRAGEVLALDWDPKRLAVRTELQVDEAIQVPMNAYAVVKANSLLGGNVVHINFDDPKTPEEMTYLARGAEVPTREVRSLDDAVEQLASLGEEGSKLFKNLDENQRSLVAKVDSILEENRDNIRSTVQSFADVGPKLNALSDRLNALTENVQKGEGTIGALFKDKTLYDQLLAFSTDAKDLAAQMKSGQGTLGKLMYDDTVAKEIEDTFRKLGDASDTIKGVVNENREAFNKLVSSLNSAAPRIESTMANMDEITAKIRAGEGTIGKLVNDDSLYNDAKRAVNQIGESFEGSEEQGVIRSFFGLLFGALI